MTDVAPAASDSVVEPSTVTTPEPAEESGKPAHGPPNLGPKCELEAGILEELEHIVNMGGYVAEYRIRMPVTLAEYQRGNLYSHATRNKTVNSDKGEGLKINVLKSEEFTHNGRPGLATHKLVDLRAMTPRAARLAIAAEHHNFTEKSWNAFPYVRTQAFNEYFGKKTFASETISHHYQVDGSAEQLEDNTFGLSPKILKKREVVEIDFAATAPTGTPYDEVAPADMKSKATGKGPWGPEWWKTYDGPVTIAVKLSLQGFKWWGLQSLVQNTIRSKQQKTIEKLVRQQIGLMDEWHPLSLAEVTKIQHGSKEVASEAFKKEVAALDAAEEAGEGGTKE